MMPNHELIQTLETTAAELRKAAELLDGAVALLSGVGLWPDGLHQKGPTKPDVQILEEMLREHGPMHVTDLVRLCPSYGVQLKDSKNPIIPMRNKLSKSKRFHLFGGNVWGLPEHL